MNRLCEDFAINATSPALCTYPHYYGIFQNISYNCSSNLTIAQMFHSTRWDAFYCLFSIACLTICLNIWHLKKFSTERLRKKKLDSVDKLVFLVLCNTILYMTRLIDPAGQNGIFSYKVETRISGKNNTRTKSFNHSLTLIFSPLQHQLHNNAHDPRRVLGQGYAPFRNLAGKGKSAVRTPEKAILVHHRNTAPRLFFYRRCCGRNGALLQNPRLREEVDRRIPSPFTRPLRDNGLRGCYFRLQCRKQLRDSQGERIYILEVWNYFGCGGGEIYTNPIIKFARFSRRRFIAPSRMIRTHPNPV